MMKNKLRNIVRKILNESATYNYTAVFVDDEQAFLNEVYSRLLKIKHRFESKTLLEKYREFSKGPSDLHMTIIFGDRLPLRSRIQDLNKQTKLNITGVGVSKDAMAVRVEGDYFSVNENQHITLAFNTVASDSKNIDWEGAEFYLFEPFTVTGTIREK